MKRKDYAAELVRERHHRDVPELLFDLYVTRRHSQQSIADALGVTRHQVYVWLQRYGISREDRAPVEIEAAS